MFVHIFPDYNIPAIYVALKTLGITHLAEKAASSKNCLTI